MFVLSLGPEPQLAGQPLLYKPPYAWLMALPQPVTHFMGGLMSTITVPDEQPLATNTAAARNRDNLIALSTRRGKRRPRVPFVAGRRKLTFARLRITTETTRRAAGISPLMEGHYAR